MIAARYLFDTSALVRVLRDARARAGWEQQIEAGLVATCPLVELEFLHTARSKVDRDQLVELIGAAFTSLPVPDEVFRRAFEMQDALTAAGTHRSAGTVDLLLAATAELADLTLVHYDHDFEQIAEVTGQPVAWLAPPGSIS
ncbi:PIN domain-containing protein [Prauserella flavalba]|uniref:Ribonuclease VapC n=1 Tax=Prauserella flavalba TaxID=1477506 RepID=A0A318LIS8_9PSEU|nr:PIN domain-containing protein [Prauserella flavalba]PXY26272.1 twitching motility protein PilT [Prauserella flavalba]